MRVLGGMESKLLAGRQASFKLQYIYIYIYAIVEELQSLAI
jgi:hypothetical protein